MTTSTSVISYKWEIAGIGTVTDPVLGLVVQDVYYAYSGSLLISPTDVQVWQQYQGGSVKLDSPDPVDFISFQNLTEAEVIAWVQSILGQEIIDKMTTNIEISIQSQRDAYINNIDWQPLPWQK